MKFKEKLFAKLFHPADPGPSLKFESIMDYLPDSLIIIDRRGIVRSVNRACRDLLGYSAAEIVGESASMFFVRRTNGDAGCVEPPSRKEDERYLGKILDELVVSGFVNGLEVVFLTKDCRRIPMDFNGVVLRDDRREITGVLGLARDMRQTKKNIRKLDALKNISLLSLEKMSVESLLSRIGETVKDFLAAGRITFYVAEGELLKSAYASDMTKEIILKVGQGIAGYVARTQKPYRTNSAPSDPHFFSEIDAATGYKTFRVIAVPVVESSKLFGVVEALDKKSDFTDEDVSDFQEMVDLAKFVVFDKINAAKLARSEEVFRELVENISDVIYSIDVEGKITYASPAVKPLLGWSPSDLAGTLYADLIHPDDLPSACVAFADAWRGKYEPLECRVRSASGKYRWVRTVGKIYHVDGKPAGIRATLSDVTGRKNAEDDLKKRLLYEKMLVDISAAAVVSETQESFFAETLALLGRTLKVSRVYIVEHRHSTDTMDNTYEWCAEGIAPQKEKLQGLPAASLPWWMASMKRRRTINYKNVEDIPSEKEKNLLVELNIKSVLCFPVYVGSEYFGFIGFDDCVGRREWNPRDVEVLKTVSQILSWVYDRRRMENERGQLYMRMLQSAKMASVGDLVAGLAHEIGNPLQTVLGNAELLLLEDKREETVAIRNAALHAKGIIENLMDFAREREIKFSEEDINAIIEKTLSLYGRQLDFSGIKVVKHMAKLPKTHVSSSHLSQVFLNIIINAKKAMTSGGTLTVVTAEEGDYVAVSFADTGVGIGKEDVKRIFEPFFTTKKEGTGLGMSLSYGIIKQHGGEISIHSEGPGKGAVVMVKLPQGKRPKASRAAKEKL